MQQSFSTSFIVNNTPQEIAKAILNIQNWWSEEITGSTNAIGDEFRYHYRDVHSCAMILTECTDERIQWHVTENYFNFVTDQTEWDNTDICFEMIPVSDGIMVRFTHIGLKPELECYAVCSDAWTRYIKTSLYNLITTGTGNPNQKETL